MAAGRLETRGWAVNRTVPVFVALMAVLVPATTHSGSKVLGTRTSARATPFLTGSFDTTAALLPHDFSGHDIAAVYDALKDVDPPQGTLETTAAYEARLQLPPTDHRMLAFVGEVAGFTKLDSEGGLEFDGSGSNQVRLTYDPDQKELKLWPNLTFVNVNERTGHGLGVVPAIPVRSIQLSSGSTTMQNAYGAVFSVRVAQYRWHLICPTNTGFSPQEYEQTKLLGTYSVSTGLAERLLGDADRSLLLCHLDRFSVRQPRLIRPVAFQSSSEEEATFDKPSSFVAADYCVTVHIDDVWLYNSKTGKIVEKFTPRL